MHKHASGPFSKVLFLFYSLHHHNGCGWTCVSYYHLVISSSMLLAKENRPWKRSEHAILLAEPQLSRRQVCLTSATCQGEGAQGTNYITEELTWFPRKLPLFMELALIRGLDCRMASCLLSSRALKMLGPINSISLDTQ